MHVEQPADQPTDGCDLWSDGRWQRPLRLAAILFFTTFYLASPTKDDISSLLVIGNALLDGQRLYLDILEPNPPMSVLIYVPAILVERATDLRAEIWVIFETLLVALVTLQLTSVMLAQGGLPPRREWFLTAGVFAVIILPLGAFGQRDHLAVMTAMPLIAALAVPKPSQLSRSSRITAGLLAGLTMCIKPQFAFAFALPALGSALRDQRTARVFQLEVWIAAAVVLGFWSIVYFVFPDFFRVMLPIITELYRPLHLDRIAMLSPVQPAGLMLLAIFLILRPLGRQAFGRWPMALTLAIAGFLGAFLEQAKGWPYHIYPAAALTVFLGLTLTLPTLLELQKGQRRHVAVWSTCFAVFLIWCLRFFTITWTDYSAVTEAVRAVDTQHPRILCIAASHGLCHPVTRDVGGVSVSTLASRWLTIAAVSRDGLGMPPGKSGRSTAGWVEMDRGYLRNDISSREPDIILIQRGGDFDWLAWAEEDPTIRATLRSRYSVVNQLRDPEGAGEVEIWKRSREDS